MDKKLVRKYAGRSCAAAVFIAAAAFSRQVFDGAAQGVDVCLKLIVPSLFPFFALSEIIIRCGLSERLGKLVQRPFSFFTGLPGVCSAAFVTGACAGYPVGARTALALLDSGRIDRSQCESLLAFCNNSGPAFIIGAVGAMLKDGGAAALLLFTHLLAALTVGVVLRPAQSVRREAAPPCGDKEEASFSQALAPSIASAGKIMLSVCCTVVFFSALISVAEAAGAVSAASSLISRAFPALSGCSRALTLGLFELSAGIKSLPEGASVQALVCASMLLGWGGLSVHAQVRNLAYGKKISLRRFTAGKALQSAISALYTLPALSLPPFFGISAALAVFAIFVCFSKGLKKSKKAYIIRSFDVR